MAALTSIQMMQGNYGSGVAHQRSGNKILSEIIFNESTGEYQHDSLSISNTPYIPMKTIEELYLRTDFALSQVSTHTQDRGSDMLFQYLTYQT
jgi:hypothetical protein